VSEADPISESVNRLLELSTPAVADACDRLGRPDRVLSHLIRPLRPDARLAGAARTQLLVEPRGGDGQFMPRACAFIDTLAPGDVVVIAAGGAGEFSCWGGLFGVAAGSRGCAGVIVDGCVVDGEELADLGLPTFSAGFSPAHAEGRAELSQIDAPVRCGGVIVEPGDYIIGDFDGVVCVPRALIERVLEIAESGAQDEGRVRELLAAGRSARELWEKTGFL